jgi:CBS domain-containing membrane protein
VSGGSWPTAHAAALLRLFRPAPLSAGRVEMVRAVAGSFLGILLTGVMSTAAGEDMMGALWLVAPMGATAVLVFAVPAGPLSQPWAVIGGNTVSAFVGVLCVELIGATWLAAAVAVSGAIGLMFALRCLHPPGGASALLMVLGMADWDFVLFPVLANSVLLVLVGIAFNTLTGRPYPHTQATPPGRAPRGPGRATADDVDAVLARYGQVLDVGRDDLLRLLRDIQLRAYQRRLREVRCGDIMSPDPLTVTEATPLEDAWGALRRRGVGALPVVDAWGRVTGIVTLADFIRPADLDVYRGFDGRLREALRRARGDRTRGPETVARIMTRDVTVATTRQALVDLVPLFAASGHHLVPVVGHDGRLAGVVTRDDLVAALSATGDGTPPA